MNDANELLECHPERVLEFVNQNREAIGNDAEFNWHLVAEVAAGNAVRFFGNDSAAALSWASAAAIIYDRLAAAVEPQEFQFFDLSAAEVRSNMIILMGPVSGHLVLDPAHIENWFFRQAGMTLGEARELVLRWDDLSSDDAFRILNLRGRLKAIEALHDRGLFRRREELSEWRSILSTII